MAYTYTFPNTGGTVSYSYSFTECEGKSVTWVVTGDTTWFNANTSSNPITISCAGNTSATQKTLTITPKVANSACTANAITLSQPGVSPCECTDIDEMFFEPFQDTGYTATTVIGSWKMKAGSSCTDVPVITSSSIPSLTANANGTITISSLPDNPGPDIIHYSASVSIGGKPCGTYSLIQNGKEVKCDCDHAGYFIRVLKTSFTFAGTGSSIKIGSGQTSCGSIRLITDSDMVRGRELEIRPLTDGAFEIWGLIEVDQEQQTRRCGILAILLDEYGHELTKPCNTGYELVQTQNACECGCEYSYFPTKYGWYVEVDDEYWFDLDRYDFQQANWSLSYVMNPCPSYYMEYDESLMGGGGSDFSTKKHWFINPSGGSYFFFRFNPNMTIPSGGEVRTTIRIYQYVDAVIENDQLVQGFPCGLCEEYHLVFHRGKCTCAIECGAIDGDTDFRPRKLDTEGGWESGYTNFYCATTGRTVLDFNGETPWATIEDFTYIDDWGNRYAAWKITYEAQPAGGARRDIRVCTIPIINGVECDCCKPMADFYQEANVDECPNCETAMVHMSVNDAEITSTCADYDDSIYPAHYYGTCGSLAYDFVSATPAYALNEVSQLQNSVRIFKNDTADDWYITYRTYIEKNGVPRWSNCYSETKTITVHPCACSCTNKLTTFSFTPNTLQPSYPNNYGDLELGEVGIINPEDDCLEYQAVFTQTVGAVTLRISNRKVIATIGDIGANTSLHVVIAINLRDTNADQECQTYPGGVIFDIVK